MFSTNFIKEDLYEYKKYNIIIDYIDTCQLCP
jgi:hypothetical protein